MLRVNLLTSSPYSLYQRFYPSIFGHFSPYIVECLGLSKYKWHNGRDDSRIFAKNNANHIVMKCEKYNDHIHVFLDSPAANHKVKNSISVLQTIDIA